MNDFDAPPGVRVWRRVGLFGLIILIIILMDGEDL